MTAFDRFEQRLPVLLDDLAIARMPDYADDLLARTVATRQRPGWSFPERWFPVSALTRSLASVPRFQLRLLVALALLVIAAIVGALVAGSFAIHRPAPFGPAANGQIAFIDGTGHILSGDPVTGQSRVVITGNGNSRVAYSRDGSRLAFLRTAAGGRFEIMTADADGSHANAITPATIEARRLVDSRAARRSARRWAHARHQCGDREREASALDRERPELAAHRALIRSRKI